MKIRYIGSFVSDNGILNLCDPCAVPFNKEYFSMHTEEVLTTIMVNPCVYDVYSTLLAAQGDTFSTHLIFVPHNTEKRLFTPFNDVTDTFHRIYTSFGHAICICNQEDFNNSDYCFFNLLDEAMYSTSSLKRSKGIFDEDELRKIKVCKEPFLTGSVIADICGRVPDLRLNSIVSTHWSSEVVGRATNPMDAACFHGGAVGLTDAFYSNVLVKPLADGNTMLLAGLYNYNYAEEIALTNDIMKCLMSIK